MRAAGVSLLVGALTAVAPSTALSYGESDTKGRPSSEERLLHVLTNQIRQAPREWPGFDPALASPEARGPLLLEPGLLEAARFHADDMAESGTFAHESSDGTSFFERLSRYFPGPAGENIYTGFGGGARAALTGWMNSSGHRMNILDGSWNRLGPGFSVRDGQVFYVQDFGRAPNGAPEPIPGAAVERIASGRLLLLANFFDARASRPRSFEAVLDDTRIALEHEGGPSGNETWSAITDEPPECTPLRFVLVMGSGRETTFPTTGALLAGRSCTATFSESRTDDSGGPLTIDADEPGGCRSTSIGPRSRSESDALALLALLALLTLRDALRPRCLLRRPPLID